MRPYTFIVKDNIISIIKFISYQLYSSTTLYPGYRIIFSPRVQPPTRPPRRAELNALPVAGFLSGRFLWTVFFFVPRSPDRGHNIATRGPAGAPNLPPRSAPAPPCAARSWWCRSAPPIADTMNGASRAPATGQALRVLTFKASPHQIRMWVVVSLILSPGRSALLLTGYLMRDGGEDATATETCSSSASFGLHP